MTLTVVMEVVYSGDGSSGWDDLMIAKGPMKRLVVKMMEAV